MEEVKREKYGSRKSVLKNVLIESNISFISNIWVITCRHAINSDKNSRYLVCIEGDIIDAEYESIVKKINKNIAIINVKFDKEKKIVLIKNIKSKQISTVSYETFKNRIIEITKCKYVESYALGSSESSPLSRYFREYMGKGFALTDIDFYLTKKNLFVEEKNFVINNEGYLGLGQCISFKEIINDIFHNVKLKIICCDDNHYYIADFKNINCANIKYINGWGKMVCFEVSDVSKNDLLNLIR